MSYFWYPEIHTKYHDGKPDKKYLLQSYIRYFLSRLQSMFIYTGLPDSIPQKWLENYLLTSGCCVWIKSSDGNLYVVGANIGGKPDVYYIPTECIVVNPYLPQEDNKTYIRDENCVLMVNDTYAQGLMPMLEKWCSLLCDVEISLGMSAILSRSSFMITACDDNTKNSAELWLKRLSEGSLGIIGESPLLVGNQDHALSVNNLSGADTTITNLIELEQYIKASLYNELGLQSNYNMKRESINSGEAQLTEDQLHPLIDNMLDERRKALEKVNEMFGTNISVEFNSAWEINEREEEAAIENIEQPLIEDDFEPTVDVDEEEISTDEQDKEEVIEEVTEEQPEEAIEETSEEELPEVEVTISDQAIEEIAEAVAEKLEEKEGEENEVSEEDK